MSSRLKRKGSLSGYDSLVPSQRKQSRPVFPEKRYEVAGRVLSVTTYLPLSVARRVRRKIYPYPYPSQKRLAGRAIRVSLKPSSQKMVKATVKIRLPKVLPKVYGSYVALSDGRMTIHSRKKLKEVIDAQEFNRRRYAEHKGNHRKARYGQLDSGGSQRFGSVAESYRRGDTIDKIADAGLAARAIKR